MNRIVVEPQVKMPAPLYSGAHGNVASRARTAKKLGVIAVAVLVLAVGWGAWSHLARSASARDAMITRQSAIPLVRTVQLTANDAPRVIDLPGTMQAFDSATLYARATGYIAKRNVDIGSVVHKGDVLIEIAAPDLDQQLAQARAQLVQMQAALLQAQAGRSLANVNNRRTSQLVTEGWNSRQQGDTDSTTLSTRSAAVGVAQANIKAAQAQVDRLVALTQFERVTAPFDGVITSRSIDVGNLVTADQTSGTALFGIARNDLLRVQVYVPQEYFFALKDGQQATITVPQLPGQVFHGLVARYAGALSENTRTVLAEVDVKNDSGVLSPGLYGIVHIEEKKQAPTVMVPSEAIIFNANGLSAAVVEDGRLAIRHLTVQADNGAQVDVKAGLKPGDKLILNPPVNLVEGMRVRES